MNSLDTFEKRLRDETASVEKEIESRNQQLEDLNQRLEGLKRAAELFEAEQGAISELLQVGAANGGVISAEMPTVPVAKAQKASAGPKPTNAQKRRASSTQNPSKAPAGRVPNKASQNGGLTRVDMI